MRVVQENEAEARHCETAPKLGLQLKRTKVWKKGNATLDWWPFQTFHQFLGSIGRESLALVDEVLHKQPPAIDTPVKNSVKKFSSHSVVSASDAAIVTKKNSDNKQLRVSGRNADLTTLVQEKKSKAEIDLVDVKVAPLVERNVLKAKQTLSLYKDGMNE